MTEKEAIAEVTYRLGLLDIYDHMQNDRKCWTIYHRGQKSTRISMAKRLPSDLSCLHTRSCKVEPHSMTDEQVAALEVSYKLGFGMLYSTDIESHAAALINLGDGLWHGDKLFKDHKTWCGIPNYTARKYMSVQLEDRYRNQTDSRRVTCDSCIRAAAEAGYIK